MIEIPQSNLLTMISGVVLASCLLGVAAWERGQGEDAAIVSALDEIALQVARAHCSPTHPLSSLPIAAALRALPDGVTQVLLLNSHLTARTRTGGALSSVEFPPLPLAAPLELLGTAALTLTFDFLSDGCVVSAA